jgi:hypothetical protein
MKREIWFLSMLFAFVIAAGLARADEPTVNTVEYSRAP